MSHDFLILSLLFCVPGVVVWWLRRDLRPVIRLSATCSLPFAATERFFYPDYWSPKFLFDLVDRIGFGVEDLLFVTALAAFTTTAYPFAARRRLTGTTRPLRAVAASCAGIVLSTLGVALVLLALRVPILYGSFGAMSAGAVYMLARRRDLALPSLLGGLLSTGTYAALCLAYAVLLPGVFTRVWHTERFLHRFVFGVPLEELLYGLCAGVAAAAFYPFVTGQRFAPQRTDSIS